MKYYKQIFINSTNVYPVGVLKDGILLVTDSELKTTKHKGWFEGTDIDSKMYYQLTAEIKRKHDYFQRVKSQKAEIVELVKNNRLFFEGNMSMLDQLKSQRKTESYTHLWIKVLDYVYNEIKCKTIKPIDIAQTIKETITAMHEQPKLDKELLIKMHERRARELTEEIKKLTHRRNMSLMFVENI